MRDVVIPADKDGSITREVLRTLLKPALIRRHAPRILEQGRTTAPPIHVLTQRGAAELAAATGDVGKLLPFEPGFRDWMSLHHFCALSQFHITVDAAVASQSRVAQHALYFEHEQVSDSAEPARRFRLYTAFPDTNVRCVPDSAFEIEVAGHRRVIYVEREMGSDTPSRVAAKKHKGYAQLDRTGLHRRLFPQARDFRVLAVCPYAGWRDLLRAEMRGKAGAELWLFCDVTAVTPDAFLHGPLLYTIDKGPLPFVPGPAPAAPSPAGGGAGGSAGGES